MEIEHNIEKALERSGRAREDILLLAVTKTQSIEQMKEAMEEGFFHFGENRVQELMEKYEAFPEKIQWHLIGHLQTNKVKYIIDKVDMIQAVDSLRLAEEIEKRAVLANKKVDILIEINIAKESSKFGLLAEELENFLLTVSKMEHLCIKGLMTVAPFVENAEENRKYFQEMRELLVDMNGKKIHNVCMEELSMGMTNDYMVAIEEGATIVRVGTAIFGARAYQ